MAQTLFDWVTGWFWTSARVRRVWVRQANHGWGALVTGCAEPACSCNADDQP